VVEMYTTNRFWVEEHDCAYVQYAAKCVINMLVDDTFREEIYDAFATINVEYTKKVITNDNFKYHFDYNGLIRRLESLLRDGQYYYTKGTIMENVIRMSEILVDLDSDVYLTKRHGIPEPTMQLRTLFGNVITRCVNRYLELGMLRYRILTTVYYDGSLKPLKTTYLNRTDANQQNYSRYASANYHTLDTYCLLWDIVDMRGHLNINLEKTSELLKRKLTAEVIDEFGAVDVGGTSSQTASVLITGSGPAYDIREDLVRADISHAFLLHVDNDTESERNIDSESDGEDSDASSRERIATRVGRECRMNAEREE
jgi:hypothetical protein